MSTRSVSFERPDVSTEILIEGTGPVVVMIASLGRPAQDFDDLAHRIAAAGFAAVRPQPRGIGKSVGPMSGISLRDLANDVATVIERLALGPAVLIGHAFGQRVARTLATMRPELVKGIVLLAAGGKVPIPEPAREALSACFDLALPDDKRMENVQYAFFAPGNDPTVWRSGWYPEVARMQRETSMGLDRSGATALRSGGSRAESVSVDTWWAGGSVPLLVVQGLQDRVAVPENGRLLKAEFSDRVRLVEVDCAGHALLPEQPEIVATEVLSFLAALCLQVS
jgi:pimeloyl-ACP methyl ester carboxylesterase